MSEWKLVPWDGNRSLGHRCWEKEFGRGKVSIGAGAFLLITHSFGATSDRSFSDTRWRKGRQPLSEEEAMKIVDKRYSK